MSEKTPHTNERPILVPRGQKIGEDPADRKVEVWTLTDMVAENGKSIARSQAAEQLGNDYGIVEKTISDKTLSEEGQNALAREYAGQPLKGDTVSYLGDHGVFEDFTLGDTYRTGDGPLMVIITDAEGLSTGIRASEIFKTKEQSNTERLERTQEAINEGVAARGEAALHAAGVEAPISPEDQAEALQREIKKVETEIIDMTEGLSDLDKRAMWHYATSLYPAESESAKRKLSFKFEENNPGLLAVHKAAYQRLHVLRVQAGTLAK